MPPKFASADKRKTPANALSDPAMGGDEPSFPASNAPRELHARCFGFVCRENAFPRRREPFLFEEIRSTRVGRGLSRPELGQIPPREASAARVKALSPRVKVLARRVKLPRRA
jgi:hypothetical protein